ncbi:Dynactin subunit 1, partial [Bienertia sinuspersici]
TQKGRPLKTTGVGTSSDSGSSGKRSRDDDSGSEPPTPTSGAMGEGHMPRPEGVKKAKSRLKGKFKAKGAYECIESFHDRIQLMSDERTKKSEEHERRLQFMMEKEARKKQQMEMVNKQMQMDQYRMK